MSLGSRHTDIIPKEMLQKRSNGVVSEFQQSSLQTQVTAYPIPIGIISAHTVLIHQIQIQTILCDTCHRSRLDHSPALQKPIPRKVFLPFRSAANGSNTIAIFTLRSHLNYCPKLACLAATPLLDHLLSLLTTLLYS